MKKMNVRAENVNEMTGRLRKSYRQVHRAFANSGMTPKKFIENNRLSEMLSLFESSSSISLNEIAMNCGYTTYEAFQKACIRRFDMPPRELLMTVMSSQDVKKTIQELQRNLWLVFPITKKGKQCP